MRVYVSGEADSNTGNFIMLPIPRHHALPCIQKQLLVVVSVIFFGDKHLSLFSEQTVLNMSTSDIEAYKQPHKHS
ncbi:hypothetical protein D3C81_2151910 [compost metagenome]